MKIKITADGCYGNIDGIITMLPIGYIFESDIMPAAFIDRSVVLENKKIEVSTPHDQQTKIRKTQQ